MIPFELSEPGTFAEAVGLLDPGNPTIRPIAGGTALMLMMKSGVFQPSRLVSLRNVEPHYARVELSEDGGLRAGALASLGGLERDAAVIRAFPVLKDTLRVLSNVRVRNVATIGGNLAHADPHMDLPPVLVALDASVTAVAPSGTRTIAVADLFAGYYETTLAADELISELVVPPQRGRRSVYIKCTTRSAHDWPALGVAVSLQMAGAVIADARIVLSAAVEKPQRMTRAEAAVNGEQAAEAALRAAAEAAAIDADVISDVRGSAPYKRQLIRVNVMRALQKAVASPNDGAVRS